MTWWRNLLLLAPAYGEAQRDRQGVQVISRQQPQRQQVQQLVRQPVVAQQERTGPTRERADDGGRSR
jgi:hypothetical protein